MGLFKNLLPKKKRRKRNKYPTYGRKPPSLESKAGAAPPPRQASGNRSRRTRPTRRYQHQHWFKRLIKRVIGYGFVATVLLVAWFSIGLPDIEDLNKFTKAPSILIKSEDGRII